MTVANPEMTDEDVALLIAKARQHSVQAHAWTILGAYAGLRATEISQARSDWFNSEKKTMRVPSTRFSTAPVAAAPIVLDTIRGMEKDGPLWDATPAQITSVLRDLGIHIHALRRYFAALVFRLSEGDPLLTMQLLRRHPRPDDMRHALFEKKAQPILNLIGLITPPAQKLT